MEIEDFMLLIGIVAGILLGAILSGLLTEPPPDKTTIICEYINGRLIDGQCVLDGKVVEIE